jgi:RND family efflux transporter MFP subunit
MKKIRRIILPLLVIAVGIAGYVLLRSSAPVDQPLEPSERVWSVNAVSVARKQLSPTLRLYGRVESPRETHLRAAVSADVQELMVLSGQNVRNGELLLRLDDDDVSLLLRQRDADVSEIEAQIESEKRRHAADLTALTHERMLYQLAERSLKRAERLAKTQVGSQARVDEAQQALRGQALALAKRQRVLQDHPSRLAQLHARLKRATAVRDMVRRDLRHTGVMAPFDGRITAVHVSPGDRVRPGDRLIDVYDTNFVEIRTQVPNRHLPVLRKSLLAGSEVTALMQFEGRSIRLALDRLAGKIEKGQGGVDAFFSFLDETQDVELGRTVVMFVELPVQNDVFSLPATSVYGADTVYRIENSRLVMARVRRVGEYRNGEWGSWILFRSDDLVDGDQILANQLPNAVQGLKVEIVQAND